MITVATLSWHLSLRHLVRDHVALGAQGEPVCTT